MNPIKMTALLEKKNCLYITSRVKPSCPSSALTQTLGGNAVSDVNCGEVK